MSLTLGLNTALSGLLTNQRALDTIAQNVSNVNTEGYTRKVLNLESRVVNGTGAGVQVASLERRVSESLMKELRRQNGALGELAVQQEIFPQIEDLFGQVADNTSISHQLTEFSSAYSDLASDPNNSSTQWSVVQAAVDVSSKLDSMTLKLQDLRLQADRDMETKVDLVNQHLGDIHDLNKKIVKYGALATGTTDLEDLRDRKLNDLSELIDIQYYRREDGAMTVFTGSGQLLLDNQPETVVYSATSTVDAWMTAEDGQFRHIAIEGVSENIDDDIRSGSIRAYLDMRDSTLPNLQSQIDQLAGELRKMVNKINNSGTSQPNIATSYEGTRTFGVQSNFGADGQQITISGSADVMMVTFDSSGNELFNASLKTIMDDAGHGTGPWSIDDLASTMQTWLQTEAGCTNAEVKLDDTGHFIVNTGTTNTSLCFRDQASSAKGAEAAEVTIEFDSNGDGATDTSVVGFSNFFGLNDLMVRAGQNSMMDSLVMPADFKTDKARDLSLYDTTGQLGTTIIIPKNSSLEDIARQINVKAKSTDSAALSSAAMTLTSNATVTVSDASGLQFPAVTLNAGSVTLDDIATALNSAASAAGHNAFSATVVRDGTLSRLRLTDSRGNSLAVTIEGGLISGSSLNLDQTLNMTAKQQVAASVISSGAGEYLRLRQGDNRELFLSSTLDGAGENNLITDLGLEISHSGMAGMVAVRSDIQGSPNKISRGSMNYDVDRQEYYLSAGDNSTATAMADSLNGKIEMKTAGDIFGGVYSFAGYAAASISVVAAKSADSLQKYEYQSTLSESLQNQNSSYSAVNLDEEVAALTEYQQAYAASAKVISTLQEMLEVLVNIIK